MANRIQKLQSQLTQPLSLCVSGAAGNIAYAMLFQIGSGAMLGHNQPIHLRLLDLPGMQDKLKGVEMELRDCAFPVFASITCTSSYEEAFKDLDLCILVGAKPRGPGMERKDLLKANAAIFKGQGEALNKYAKRSVKVCVVGNPANTNAMIAAMHAPDIPKENITALTRLDQNRALGLLSDRTGIAVSCIKNVIVWGNHSKTQFPDTAHSYVQINGDVLPLRSLVNADHWLNEEFMSTVQDRGAAIIKARGMSSAASAANAAVEHMRDWVLGTAPGEFVSMAVPSDGSYGVPTGLIFSFPVKCKSGRYEIVQGLAMNDFAKQKMALTIAELVQEKTQAISL